MKARLRFAGKRSTGECKSIVRILAEGIGQGTKIEIAAEGTDEEQAAASLATLVEGGFGE